MVYTGPVVKRTSSSGGARWLSRAERIARGLSGYARIKREIHDGYIVEGKKVGGHWTASVLDPAIYLAVVGPSPLFYEDLSRLRIYFEVAALPCVRDVLRPSPAHPDPAVPLPRTSQTYYAADAVLKLNGSTLIIPAYNASMYGGVIEPSGLVTYGLSMGRPASGVVRPGEALPLYKSAETPTYYEFAFRTIIGTPNASSHDQGLVVHDRASLCRGFFVDSGWLDAHVGGGLQSVMDWPGGGSLGIGSDRGGSQWFDDSYGLRYQRPWAVAVPVEILPDSIVWQVGARLVTPPSSGSDVWGCRQLVSFRVRTTVSTDEDTGDIISEAELLGVVDRYNPLLSSDPTRVPHVLGDGTWWLNSFAAPVSGPNGTMIVPHVVTHVQGLTGATSYNVVLINTEGSIIEVAMPAGMRRSAGWFIGGFEVDGEVYFLNPFLEGGILCLVHGDTGLVTTAARPAWEPPLDDPMVAAHGFSEDLMYNTVSYVGMHRVGFPVAVSGTIMYAELDLTTMESVVLGVMWPRGPAIQGGISRIGVVQYATESSPAVLLGGFHFGLASLEGRTDAGRTYISYDGGVTWDQLSAEYGPARVITVMGNGLFNPRVGELWGPETVDD